MRLKAYSKKKSTGFSLGPFPTFELIRHREQSLLEILYSSQTRPELLAQVKACTTVPLRQSDREIQKIANKENTYLVGVFETYEEVLHEGNHLVLVSPSNYGNLGTIMRTALGLGYRDIALIEPGCDHFHPQVIRASMGALFSLRVQRFADIEAYLHAYPHHQGYAFMTERSSELSGLQNITEPHCLIFGNESTGLPETFAERFRAVSIEMDQAIDSFNITVAASIAMYVFRQKNKA